MNLINNAKWAYEMIRNVNPNVEMIVSIDIQMTASIEYADLALPANSWLEFQDLEVTASCSNPFLQDGRVDRSSVGAARPRGASGGRLLGWSGNLRSRLLELAEARGTLR